MDQLMPSYDTDVERKVALWHVVECKELCRLDSKKFLGVFFLLTVHGNQNF